MGAVTGFLGLGGGAAGTGFGGPSGQVSDPTGNANLQTTYQKLQDVAAGNGPNPAMAKYNENIQNLAKQQAGAISSVQGISPALTARLASQQGSAAMQNAAAQGANMQAEQQLGALGQMGNVAGQQANIAAGLQQNVNNVNAGLAGGVMGMQSTAIGGAMNGGGKGLFSALAGGGEVKKMADGGMAGPQSAFAQFLSSRANNPQALPVQQFNMPSTAISPSQFTQPEKKSAPENSGQGPTAAAAGRPVSGIPYTEASPAQRYGLGFGAAPVAPETPGFARGGKVSAMLSPGEKYIPPGKLKRAAKVSNPLSLGKTVPGKPKVPGNSYANDVVPAKLEAGGVVIPNSIMQSGNPAQGAKDFIADIIAKRKARK